jgi:hypothetical protein
MDLDRIYHVSNRPPPAADWSNLPGDGSRLFVTRDAPPLPPGQSLPRLKELWTYWLKPAALQSLLAASSLELLSISGSHAPDLDFLRAQPRLCGLAIDWSNKARSIGMLAALTGLELLSLQDLKHVHDLAPLAGLANLRALQIAGGMDSRMEIESLGPLAGLSLADLRLANVRIGDGRLDALAALPRLETLSIASNAAPLDEFARLSALIPDVRCDNFQPYVPLDGAALPPGADPVAALDSIGDGRVIVTGKGNPILRARTDRSRLLRYCERYAAARRSAGAGLHRA